MIAEKSSVEEESMGNNGRLLRVASASVKTVATVGAKIMCRFSHR